jgi:SH3-like domain-containing protein
MKLAAIKFNRGMVILLGLLVLPVQAAYALEYVSVMDKSAILYDANSFKAKKLFVVTRYTPLEKVVNLGAWIKIRDSSGTMAWIERKAVSDTRYVVVTVPLATVRQSPEFNAPVIFQLAQNVAVESLGVNGGGWIKIRHNDGSVGFMRSVEVWGAE